MEHPGASFGAAARGPTPRVRVRRGMVLESLGDSFVGEVVALRGTAVVLRDRRGRERAFDTVGAGFMLDDRLVELDLPAPAAPHPAEPAVTPSGSIAVAHRARVARGSRIFVEGKHDAELLERVWGDDLRVEGIVVEVLDGIDDLADVVRAFAPTRERRMGVLVDHLVPGSKESRIAATVDHPHVLVAGHPWLDAWMGVKPTVVGLDAWPDVPRGQDVKQGLASALGEDETFVAWGRILASVRSYTDLQPPLVGAVEALIDFLTDA